MISRSELLTSNLLSEHVDWVPSSPSSEVRFTPIMTNSRENPCTDRRSLGPRRREAERMFSGEGFSAVCQWAIAEQGYRLERRKRETVRGISEEFKQIE